MQVPLNELIQHLGAWVVVLLVFCVSDTVEKRNNDRWDKVSGIHCSLDEFHRHIYIRTS